MLNIIKRSFFYINTNCNIIICVVIKAVFMEWGGAQERAVATGDNIFIIIPYIIYNTLT